MIKLENIQIGAYNNSEDRNPKRVLTSIAANNSIVIPSSLVDVEFDPNNLKIVWKNGLVSIFEGELVAYDTLGIITENLISTEIFFAIFSSTTLLIVVKLDFDFYETFLNSSTIYLNPSSTISIDVDTDGLAITTTDTIDDLDVLCNCALRITPP